MASGKSSPKPDVDLESGRQLPNKLDFYYTDLPADAEQQPSSEERVRKTSRFTVTNVLDTNDRSRPPPSRQRSRRNSSPSSDGSIKSTRKGLFSGTVVHGLANALTNLSTARHLNKHQFDMDLDLHGDERKQWELEQLSHTLDFDEIGIDSAPFQLVASTSLLKVHSIFSLIGLNRAYVTKCGTLIGVVALRDIRTAIELIQRGELPAVNSNHEEFDTQRRLRSISIKEVEDAKNDRLNPQLEPVQLSRTSTFAYLNAEKLDPQEEEKRNSMPCLADGSTHENVRRPWKSVCYNPGDERLPTNMSGPKIDITPPDEEDADTQSLDSSTQSEGISIRRNFT